VENREEDQVNDDDKCDDEEEEGEAAITFEFERLASTRLFLSSFSAVQSQSLLSRTQLLFSLVPVYFCTVEDV
jgi:hypothetical protein